MNNMSIVSCTLLVPDYKEIACGIIENFHVVHTNFHSNALVMQYEINSISV